MAFPKRTINDCTLQNKTVLLRTDYNVPLDSDGRVANDFRIRASIPTLRRLLDQNCRVVIVSHLGRPKGKVVESLSLEPVAKRLAQLLEDVEVRFVDQTIGHKVKMAVKRAPLGTVTVLENIRFNSGEEKNDDEFAESLAHDSGAQYFVQDGFGVVHRAHASTDTITHYLPGIAGLLVKKEYGYFTEALADPKRPLVALIGGAKISDKIQVIKRLVRLADQVVIGGAMANTFLKYNGKSIGNSVYESGQDDVIADIYDAVEKKVGESMVDNFLVLPSDVAVAHAIDSSERRRIVTVDDVTDDEYILDIGDATIERIGQSIARSQTVLWNGTFGMTELPEFRHGSAQLAQAMVERDTTSIVGGGDTAGFVCEWDSRGGESFTHVSTGGGASLDLIAGKKLPGIDALLDG